MIAPISLISAIGSLLLLSASATALPTESANTKTLQTRDWTQPINVDDACKFQHGNAFSAQTKGNGCNDWVCVRDSERYGVNLQSWCGTVGMRIDDSIFWAAVCKGGVYGWVCDFAWA